MKKRIEKLFALIEEQSPDLIREMQEDLFQTQGKGLFQIISGSMRPLIEVEDRILAKRVTPSEVQPGDIILFKNRNVLYIAT